MNKLLPSLIVAALLTACGGGGDDSPAPAAAPSSVAPAPAPAPATTTPPPAPATSTTAETVPYSSVPVASGNTTFNVGRLNTTASSSDYVVNFNGATDLTLNGNLNRLWLSAAQAGGTATINGESNVIVFKGNAIPATVTVTGSANTFYLPEGSPIKLEGTGAAMSTVKYYKPA